MFLRAMLAAAPLLLLSSGLQAQTAPVVTAADMRRHIEVLASDAFEGRKPGTAGEAKTISYIASQFQALGLEPAAGDGSWYQPVPLVEREAFADRVIWTAEGSPLPFDQGDAIFIGDEAVERVEDAPVYYVGYGLPRQYAGADLNGAVAMLLYDTPEDGDFPSFSERVKGLIEAGAAAVIGLSDEMPWSAIRGSFERGKTRLGTEAVARIQGAMPLVVAEQLAAETGVESLAVLAGTDRAVPLGLRASIDVSTRVNAYESHNVIGRLDGSGEDGQSILYLGHWDHLGICRSDDPVDKICNGAVDNASGIAMLIEVARRIAGGERPERDVLFMASTAEEMGLLGAEYFAAHPPVPLHSIVAAINIDTVAIHEAGEPVAIVGRGTTPLDGIVDATARELGRAVDSDLEANAFIQRQDGWELTRAGVPSVMVGGSFTDMKTLGAFLSGPYHQPNDDLEQPIRLEGAAEDATLMIALGRKLADPAIYQPDPR